MEELNEKVIRRRQRGVFLVLFGVSIVMLILSTRSLTGMPERVGLSISSVFLKGFHGLGSFTGQTINSIAELKRLRQKHEEALKKIDEYEHIERDYSELQRENLRLKEQLGYQIDPRFHKLPTEIISKDPNYAFSSIILNKGAKHGVKKDMPVVAYQNGVQGLAGRILEVGYDSSVMIPIFDNSCHVAARFEQNRYEGLVSGLGSKEKLLQMRYVSKGIVKDLQFGDLVVTSGMSDVFPRDILIGRVKEINSQDYYTSIECVLSPIVDFDKLEYVFIILPEERLSND